MKKLILSLTIALATLLTANAATAVVSNQSAGASAVVATPAVLDSITLFTTNATPTIVYLYDGAVTNVTGLTTNYITYTTNIVTSYITSLGTTNLHTNNVLYNVAQVNAAATNISTPIYTLVVPASGALVTYTPPSPLVFTTKITLSNNLTGVSGVISYRLQ